MSIGTILRKRREDMNLTQDQVSERARISKPYLSNIETGRAKNPPTDEVLLRLESVLTFPRGELIKLAHRARTPADVREDYDLLHDEVQQLRGVLKDLANAPRKEDGAIDFDALASQLGGKLPSQSAEQTARTLRAGALVPIVNSVAAGYPQNLDPASPPMAGNECLRVPDLHDPQSFAVRVVGDSMSPDYCQGDIVVFSPNTPARSGDDCFVRLQGDALTSTFMRFYQDEPQTVRLQPLNSRYPASTFAREQISGLWPAVVTIAQIRR